MRKFKLEIKQILDSFHDNEKQVSFWWRDDDASKSGPKLDQLSNISRDNNVLLALAVIPSIADASLNELLKKNKNISVLQHGFQHISRSLPKSKKCEFPINIESNLILKELSEGREILNSLYKESFVNGFVPPWNRFPQEYLPLLKSSGHSFISTYQSSESDFFINTHFDIINWKKGKVFIGEESAIFLMKEILENRRGSAEPIGILSHHIDHDNGCWSFLEEIIPFLKEHPAVSWPSAEALFPSP